MKWKRITISRSNFEPNLPFLAAFNLDSATNEADLNRFIDEQLQPNQSFNLEMKKLWRLFVVSFKKWCHQEKF